MKLISLNVEGVKHADRVKTFLEAERPDVVCLQEVQPDLEQFLRSLNYTVAFLPVTLHKNDTGINEEGILIASKHQAVFNSFYYYEPIGELQLFKKDTWRETCAEGVVYAKIQFEEKEYVIATTHFTWTPDGSNPNDEQLTDMVSLIKCIKQLPPHIICGDFNIPRHHNYLYEALIHEYSDTVPSHYKSSLDKNLHRLGELADKANLFNDYMVDYVFTQPPYMATDVHLEFGVSDHAAVVATIQQ